MLYSFDTSAFVNPWRKYYPPDVFPSFWEHLNVLILNEEIVATDEVLVELERKDDEVHRWVSDRSRMFISLDGDIQQAAASILNQHPRLIDNCRNRSQADPFVITVALVHDITVVTYETHSNSSNRPHIPDVCDALGIRVINVLDVIREQGLRL